MRVCRDQGGAAQGFRRVGWREYTSWVTNPLLSDRDVDFLLDEVFDLDRLLALPAFEAHSRETAAMYLDSVRKVARETLFPSYQELNQVSPRFEDGVLKIHPQMREILPQLVDLGMLTATRPEAVGGAQLPITVASLADAYLMAGNGSAHAYLGLTIGAARLIESFGSAELKERFMVPMYEGRWTGTMALTEPQAGSSLSDIRASARPQADGSYLVTGNKIFISGGSQDLTENIVHLTLARIEGAPLGTRGISLFAIPMKRAEGNELLPNDVVATGSVHKIGWKAIPSVVLNFGDEGNCRGWLVGEPHQGLKYMFQMMNEARLMVGLSGVASATVAYHQSVLYARDRPQGRRMGEKDPSQPQVAIIEHPDVRRMLLRQKAIVEGGLALLVEAAYLSDVSEHDPDETARKDAFLLLDLLTPVAKTFPAEYGFEANTIAIQIHGGYGYSSEYLPESWWRDQKLNSLHEGTSGIQSMDLLGRKVVADGGRAFQLLARRIEADLSRAEAAGVPGEVRRGVADALTGTGRLTMELAQRGMSEGASAMLRHASDYMTLVSIVAVGWMWLRRATAAQRGLSEGRDEGFYRGQLQAASYWTRTELVRWPVLVERCRSGETSFADMDPEWF